MRTLTWTSPLGIVRRVTIGGRRVTPLSRTDDSTRRVNMHSFEHFLELQRERLARRLQLSVDRVNDARMDGMNRYHSLTETTLTSRR
jgi:hypothetical protein